MCDIRVKYCHEGVTRPGTPPTDSYFRTGTSVEVKGNAMKVVVEQGRQVTDEPAVAGVARSDEQVLTYREAAQVLKVSARTLERWTREGLVPYIRLPQRGRWSGVRFSRNQLLRWLRQRTVRER